MKQIESKIIKDINTGLYQVEMLGINRQFDYVEYYFHGVIKKYGNKQYATHIDIQDPLEAHLIGISQIEDIYMVCVLDLETKNNQYFFAYDFYVKSFNIGGQTYFYIAYLDLENNLQYYTDLVSSDFQCEYEDGMFSVKNIIFSTIIYTHNQILSTPGQLPKVSDLKNEKAMINIADFFHFKNIFLVNTSDYFRQVDILLDAVDLRLRTYGVKMTMKRNHSTGGPSLVIGVFVERENMNSESMYIIRKTLLALGSESILGYYINKEDISDYFSQYITDMAHVDFGKLDLNIDIPDDIYHTDAGFLKLQYNLLAYGYNLYTMKESYNRINTTKGSDSYVLELDRNMNQDQLKKLIPRYEEALKLFIDLIKTKLS